MKLYIAGPMTGLPDFNYPAFFAAEVQLKAAGYEVENPARNELPKTGTPNERAEPMWLGFMRMSLVQISKVDGLALLPGWGDSDGAKLEAHIGRGLKLPVRYVEVWLGTNLPLGHEFNNSSRFPTLSGSNDRCGVQLMRSPCGRSKAEHAQPGRPLIEEPVRCPECVNGKTVNCTGQTLHPDTDELVACGSSR